MNSLDERRRIVAYLDCLPPIGDLRKAKVNALGELQSASGEELRLFVWRTLTRSPSEASGMPSLLDRAL
jgi:hypothetical protein